MADSDEFGSFMAGLLVGGLVGAAVALLMAPQSGEETRQVIQERGIELKDRAVVYGTSARDRAVAAVDDARVRADDALEDLRHRTNELASLAREKAMAVQIPGEKPTSEATPPAAAE
jgi:gas vesicle protein